MNNKFGTTPVRRVAIGGTVALATTAAAAALLIPTLPALADDAEAAQEWEHVELPLPDDLWRGIASSVNSTGDFVGGISGGDNVTDPDNPSEYPSSMATVWNDGEPTVLDFPEPASYSWIQDVNDAGTAVGHFYLEDEEEAISHAFAYIDGETVALPLPEDVAGGVKATGINNDGTIVGSLRAEDDAKAPPSDKDVPLVWNADGSEVTVLDLPEGAEGGGAHGIDDSGSIVGHSDIDDGTPVVWNAQGEPRELPSLGDYAVAESIEGDWISGHRMYTGPVMTRWTLDGEEAEETPLMSRGDIAANGDIAGTRLSDNEQFEEAVLLDAEGNETALPGPSDSSQARSITPDSSVVSGQVTGPDHLDHDLPSLWVHQGS